MSISNKKNIISTDCTLSSLWMNIVEITVNIDFMLYTNFCFLYRNNKHLFTNNAEIRL